MSEQKMPDEIYIRPPRWGGDSISIAVRDDTGTKYHHRRIVEAKDAEIERLKIDAKEAEDDFEAMYQMVKSRNAEIERLQKLWDADLNRLQAAHEQRDQALERERVLREGLEKVRDYLSSRGIVPHRTKGHVAIIEQTLSQTQKESE